MENQEQEITELIEKIQKIDMCKNYLTELNKMIEIESRKLDMFIRRRYDLNTTYDQIKDRKRKIFFISAPDKSQIRKEKIKAEFKIIDENLKQCQKKLDEMNFELGVLQDKIDQEPNLRKALNQLILDRAQMIQSSGSNQQKQLLKIVVQLDYGIKLHQEIKEIIDEGDNVIRTIDAIQINILHNLNKTYNTDRKTESYATISQKVVEQIQMLALQLKESLKDFKKELKDVYDDNMEALTQHHERIKYYNALVRAEILVKHLLQKKMDKEQADQLGNTKQTIIKINNLFEEELRLTAEFIRITRDKKTKLLME